MNIFRELNCYQKDNMQSAVVLLLALLASVAAFYGLVNFEVHASSAIPSVEVPMYKSVNIVNDAWRLDMSNPADNNVDLVYEIYEMLGDKASILYKSTPISPGNSADYPLGKELSDGEHRIKIVIKCAYSSDNDYGLIQEIAIIK